MNTPLALALACAGGLCLLVGGWRLWASRWEPEKSRRATPRIFGAACLVIAGQEYTALGVYRALDLAAYVQAVRLHTVFALTAPVAIVWFVTLQTETVARRLLVRWLLRIYTGAVAAAIVLNLVSPMTMHFSDVLEVGGAALPWGERLTQATAIPSRWPPFADYLIGLFCALCAYALWTDSRIDADRSRRLLEAGLGVLVATMFVELLDPRRVSALPVDEFGLLVFVVVVGVGLQRSPLSGIAPPGDDPGDPSSHNGHATT